MADPRWLNPWLHRTANALGALFSVFLIYRALRAYSGGRQLTDLLYAITATIEVVLYLIRRQPTGFQPTVKEAVISMFASFGLVFISFAPGFGIWPAVGAGLMIAGLALQIWAKVYLGRAYAVFAANRGVVTGGPYAWVRHPIYSAYLLVTFGMLLGHFHAWNMGLLAVVYLMQVWRLLNEERLLGADPAYQDYRRRVRRRLIPGVI